MTQKQKDYKKQLIKKIQINKHNVFLDDEERREFMKSRFGVDSTTKMGINELNTLLAFCTGKIRDIPVACITDAQTYTLLRIYTTKYGFDLTKLLQLSSRIAKRTITDIDQLSKYEANKVIYVVEKKHM